MGEVRAGVVSPAWKAGGALTAAAALAAAVCAATWRAGWVDAPSLGLAGAGILALAAGGVFLLLHWAAMLVALGTFAGSVVGQGVAWVRGSSDLVEALATFGVVGALVGLLLGAVAADWWRDRHDPDQLDQQGWPV
jgi:hypothetical protein